MCMPHVPQLWNSSHCNNVTHPRMYQKLLRWWMRGDDSTNLFMSARLRVPQTKQNHSFMRDLHFKKRATEAISWVNSSWYVLSQKGDPGTVTEVAGDSDWCHVWYHYIAFQWAPPCSYAGKIDSVRTIQGRKETDGLAMRTVSSLRVTEKGCINKLFSSEAQSGAYKQLVL